MWVIIGMKLNKLLLGLTGNSGSGKSVVSGILSNHKACIVDADKISREIMQPGKPAYNETLESFGSKILLPDKTINRKLLGDIIFTNENLRIKLMDISHKYILEESFRQINDANRNNNYKAIIMDAPLLIEADLHKVCHQTWVVYASAETRAKRITKRDNCTYEQVYNRFNSQSKFEYLKQFADLLIENEGDLQSLEDFVLDHYYNLLNNQQLQMPKTNK